MTSYPFKSVGLAQWPTPSSLEYQCYMRGGAATVGDVLMMARLQGDDAGVTFTAGAGNQSLSTHLTANVLAPTAAGILHNTAQTAFGVAVRAAADDALVRLCFFGYVSAFVIDTSASVAIGDALTITTAKNLEGGAAAANELIIAQAQEVMTTPTTRTLGEVGLNGIGNIWTGHHDASP